MVDSDMQSVFDIKGLSLIDVTSEDDCLINSPLPDPINLQFSGFLEPEELSSMFGGSKKGEIHALPGKEEDVNKSCDAETLPLESLEADLFEDISASIQKSNKVSNTANSDGKKESKTTDSRTVSSSKKLEHTTHYTMKQKAAPKKPNIGVKDSGKTLKQVSSVRPQSSQSVARSGESTSSLHKPPKGPSRVGPISTTPTKRVSLGAKNVKMEKDAKSVTGIRTAVLKIPTLGGSRNVVPRSTLSSKSSSRSPSTGKTELTISYSSLERCASVSFDNSIKSSLNMIKQKNDSRIVNPSSSGYPLTAAFKIAAKGNSQAGRSLLSTFIKSSTKLSSSISLARSNGEWSLESSSSSASAANKRSNIVRASLGSGSRKGLVTSCDALQVLDSQNHPIGQCLLGDDAEVTSSLDESVNKVSAGSIGLHPALIKSSSLRLPSPKTGFSNGARSSGYSPNRSMLSHSSVPIGLREIGAKTTSPSVSSNKAPVRTITTIQSSKVDVKQTSSALKSRSSLSIQKSSTAATKVLNASRNSNNSPEISPKLQNKSSPRTGRESYSKAKGNGSAAKIVGPGFRKLVAGMGGKAGACIKDTKIVPLDRVPKTSDDLDSKSDVQNMITSKEAAENETYSPL